MSNTESYEIAVGSNPMDHSMLAVRRLGTDGEGRVRYGYCVLGDSAQLAAVGCDLRTGVGSDSGSRGMLGTLCAFLEAAGDHYRFQVMHMGVPIVSDDPRISAYEPHFNAETDEWAYQHSDELSMLRLDIEQ